jgi:hypothetical protein
MLPHLVYHLSFLSGALLAMLELFKNEFPCIPENRTHGGGVCYTVRLTDITRSRTQAELKQSYFEPVLVQEPTDQVGQPFKWYPVEDSILCATVKEIINCGYDVKLYNIQTQS